MTGRLRRRRVGLERAKDVPPLRARQDDVERDRHRLDAARQPKRLLPVAGSDRHVRRRLQVRGERRVSDVIVLDNEHALAGRNDGPVDVDDRAGDGRAGEVERQREREGAAFADFAFDT